MYGEMDKDQSKSISLQEFVEYYSGHRTEARSEFLDASLTPSLQRNAFALIFVHLPKHVRKPAQTGAQGKL